ncbi:PhnA domain-containing protein [Rufibacter aurantiacus]
MKKIRLTDDVEEIEGRVERTVMVLKTCFLKKV